MYGTPSDPVVDGLALPAQTPVDDILGRARGTSPDVGAVEAFHCPGDVDGDGDVDNDDLSLALPVWPGPFAQADFDNDGRVTVLDLTMITTCL
jgi:hypothetical protein